MKTKWAYVLIGNDRTGKTTFQKELIYNLTQQKYDKLHCNKEFVITCLNGLRHYESISFMNRSFQEKIDEYVTVDNFFKNFFKSADITIISSHLDKVVINDLLLNLSKRFYNVAGVFFSNSIFTNKIENEDIATLLWNKKIEIQNNESLASWEDQIAKASYNFV